MAMNKNLTKQQEIHALIVVLPSFIHKLQKTSQKHQRNTPLYAHKRKKKKPPTTKEIQQL